MRVNTPCASCKLLRRRCGKDCIFAPYFPPNDPHKFTLVHKVFGASNVSKMLLELPVHQRSDAVNTLVYEASARIRDPVYGCVGAISLLQNQVSQLQMQLALAQAEILYLQMQQEEALALLPRNDIEPVEEDQKQFTLHGNSNVQLPQFLDDFGSYSSGATDVTGLVVQDSLEAQTAYLDTTWFINQKKGI